MRCAGVLLPIASLPGDHYIGDLGNNAFEFVDILKKMNTKIWQILPVNSVGYGNSPYQSSSDFAGEIRLINIEKIYEMGLISSFEKKDESKDRIDYDAALKIKEQYFKEAYINFKKSNYHSDFKSFCESNEMWLNDYALFNVLSIKNNFIPWNLWVDSEKHYSKSKDLNISELEDQINYYKFLQYLFFKQWYELKKYANENDILIMGDLPVYVGYNSVDVWSDTNSFLLKEDLSPSHVAGVPGDNHSRTGQLWGNPLYDWDKLLENDFEFWVKRLKMCHQKFDITRIDHFRAFDTYWKIPAESDSALVGEWVEAPGVELLSKIYEKIPNINMVVEDLGDIRDEVLQLRDRFNLKGMSIFMYEFDPSNNKLNDKENMIIYSGTHDNQTLLGWYNLQDENKKEEINKFLRQSYNGETLDMMIKYIFDNKAEIAIIPVQDIIGQDDYYRINTPGTVGSPNWEYKLKNFNELNNNIEKINEIVISSKRFFL